MRRGTPTATSHNDRTSHLNERSSIANSATARSSASFSLVGCAKGRGKGDKGGEKWVVNKEPSFGTGRGGVLRCGDSQVGHGTCFLEKVPVAQNVRADDRQAQNSKYIHGLNSSFQGARRSAVVQAGASDQEIRHLLKLKVASHCNGNMLSVRE